jgi:DNA-binding transcriptional MerR regulator
MAQLSKLYYSIGEVSSITDVKPHILRFWENEFPMLRPQRHQSGKDRRYRERDIQLIRIIKQLVYHEKYTIDGARKKLQDRHFLYEALKEADTERNKTTEWLHEDLVALWKLIKPL